MKKNAIKRPIVFSMLFTAIVTINIHAQQIKQSGITVDNFGKQILITQGLSGCTLIAGKQILFRVFVNPSDLPQVAKATFNITGTNGALQFNKTDLIIESSAPNGPSVGFIVPGIKYPKAGDYGCNMQITASNGNILTNIVIGNINFQPAVDLRLLVFYLYGADWYWPTPAYTEDVRASMLRLGAMFPVRDGVQDKLNTDKCSGIRYQIGNPSEAYGKGCLFKEVCAWDETRQINSAPGDHIDVTVEFRPGLFSPEWIPSGEINNEPGGNSGRPDPPYSDLPRAACVCGFWNGIYPTASCFAQEIGHNFGLVDPSSPHYDGDKHSKDQIINDPYAYDFVNHRRFVTINDAMGSLSDNDAVMFSAFDWNDLQKKMVAQLQSTGTETNACAPAPPSPILSYWDKSLLGHFNNVAGISASYNIDDGYMVALVGTKDGDVYELFYKDNSTSVGNSVIGHYNEGVIDVTGFYNKDDQYRVAIVATKDGNIHEIFYSPTKGTGESIIGHFEEVKAISGFFADDDKYRIVIVATNDGNIHELFYNPSKGRGQNVIAHYDGIIDLSANYGSSFHPDDRSVIITTNNGTAYQVLYNPNRKMVKQPYFRGKPGVKVASSALATYTINTAGKFEFISSNFMIAEQIISSGIQNVTDLSVDYFNGNLICSTSDGNVYRLGRLIR